MRSNTSLILALAVLVLVGAVVGATFAFQDQGLMMLAIAAGAFLVLAGLIFGSGRANIRPYVPPVRASTRAPVRALHALGPQDPAPLTNPATAAHLPSEDEEHGFRRALRNATGIAYLVRLVLGIGIVALDLQDRFAPDARVYPAFGREVSRYWTSGIALAEVGALTGGHGRYTWLNAVVEHLFGLNDYIMILITALAGALTVRCAGQIAHILGGPRVGTWALWIATFFPSLVLWSALNLRDPFTTLGLTGATLGALRLKESWGVRGLVSLTLYLLLIAAFREYLAFFAAGGLSLSFALGRRGNLVRNYTVALLALVIIGTVVSYTGVAEKYVSKLNVESVQENRRGFQYQTGSVFGADIELETTEDAVRYLPLGIAYFLFAPFPWQAKGALQMTTIPEMIFWYFLCWKALIGIVALTRRSLSGVWTVFAVAGIIIVVYGLVSGNAGTAYRHRGQIIPMLLTLSAAGWVHSRSRGNVVASSPRHAPHIAAV